MTMLKDVPHAELTEKIIGAAIEVHKTLGPGLKEEVYEASLEVELGLRGMKCKRQVPVNREEYLARLSKENPVGLKMLKAEEDGERL